MKQKAGNRLPFPAFTPMRMRGLEPLRLAALEPKSSASANSATSAHQKYHSKFFLFLQEFLHANLLILNAPHGCARIFKRKCHFVAKIRRGKRFYQCFLSSLYPQPFRLRTATVFVISTRFAMGKTCGNGSVSSRKCEVYAHLDYKSAATLTNISTKSWQRPLRRSP